MGFRTARHRLFTDGWIFGCMKASIPELETCPSFQLQAMTHSGRRLAAPKPQNLAAVPILEAAECKTFCDHIDSVLHYLVDMPREEGSVV